ncbi:MAG: hypothetical protein IVW56_11525 [Candidatus Binataceae bacterium]|nr:hypothetical protein [Candidatus Binataceae bacterium]
MEKVPITDDSEPIVVEDIASGEPIETVTARSKQEEHFIRFAREFARGTLAFVLAGIFAYTVYIAFSNVGDPKKWENTKQLLDVLIPTESALLGTAVAFFFGLP